jgi:leader peptidase (prepilin peptidase) / N-methyltransferase
MNSLTVFFFILGAIFGSFFNVVIYRVPRNESIVHPGSHCPNCGTSIQFYDNIPFVSFLVLRGHCRKCGQHISMRYLLVEMITAFMFAAFYHLLGLSIELPIFLVFGSLLVIISFIDLDHYIIPDIFSLGGLCLGIAVSFFRPFFSYKDSFIGVLVGGGILYAIAKSYELVRKREGMGGGDIKLLGMIGAFCGWKGVIFSLVTGSFAGTIVGVPLMLIKRQDARYALPFGPFLSAGALIFAIAGDDIIRGVFDVLARR